MLKRMKVFGRRCAGKVGRFLRRPVVVRVVVWVAARVVSLLLKLLIIALLTTAGLALPVG